MALKAVEFVRGDSLLNGGAGRPAILLDQPNDEARGSASLLVFHHPHDREGSAVEWVQAPAGGQHWPGESFYVITDGDRPLASAPPAGYSAPPVETASPAAFKRLEDQLSQMRELLSQVIGAQQLAATPHQPDPSNGQPPVTPNPDRASADAFAQAGLSFPGSAPSDQPPSVQTPTGPVTPRPELPQQPRPAEAPAAPPTTPVPARPEGADVEPPGDRQNAETPAPPPLDL